MATIYRNPMPRDGALFIENPRRRRRGRKSAAQSRNQRNAREAMRLLHSGEADSLQEAWDIVKGGRGRGRRRSRRKNPWYEAPNWQKGMSTESSMSTASRAATKAFMKKHGISQKNYAPHKQRAPRHQAAAKRGFKGSAKAMDRAEALSQAFKQLKGKKMSRSARMKKANKIASQIIAKQKRPTIRGLLTGPVATTRKPRSAAQAKRIKMLKKFGGRGLTRKQLEKAVNASAADQKLILARLQKTRGRKPASTGRGRTKWEKGPRGGLRRKVKGKWLYKSAAAKHGSAYERKRARRERAVGEIKGREGFFGPLTLPFLNPRRRRNPQFRPISTLMGWVSDGTAMVQRVPGVKHLAWALPTAALFWGTWYVQNATASRIAPPLSKIPWVGGWIERHPFFATSLILGPAMGFLSSKGLLSAKGATALSVSLVGTGIIMDKAAAVISDEAAAPIMEEVIIAENGTILSNGNGANGNNSYSDGMFYHTGAATQALGDLNAYADAALADAASCPTEMNFGEVKAALGQAPFSSYFPPPPHRRKNTTGQSRHAGALGHRYGWLIKMIGPKAFARLAERPPKERHDLIRAYRSKAMQSSAAPQQESASQPLSGVSNGAQGHTSSSYGALMFAGREIY